MDKNNEEKGTSSIPNDVKYLYSSKAWFKPVVAASISGGCFPHQLSALRKLSRSGLNPRVGIGASGGNVSLYLSLAGRWKPDGIERIASNLTEKFFIESWYPYISDYIPTELAILMSYSKGSIYRPSDLSSKLFDLYFSPGDITETEIWVGAVNEKTGSLALFCNRCRDQSIIKGNRIDRRMFKVEKLNWFSGDKDKICKSIVASSAVPTIVEPVLINDVRYVDCGVKFASPLTPLRDEIRAIAKENNNSLHIIYLSGYDVESDIQVTPLNNMLQHGKVVGTHVVRAMVMHDRDSARQLITEMSSMCSNSGYVCYNDIGDAVIHFRDIDNKAINKVYERLSNSKCCLFELYPTSPSMIDYTKFTGKDVVSMMNESDLTLKGRLWWSGDPNLFDGIDGVMGNIYH